MKILHRFFSVFLMAGMLFGFLQPASALAAVPGSAPAISADDKIETQLLEQFTAEGTADFIVRFTQQADLAPAYGMSWEERGWFVYNTLTEISRLSQANAIDLLDKDGYRHQTFIAGNDLYVWQGSLAEAQTLAGLPEVQSIRQTRTYTIDPVYENPSKLASATWAGDLLAKEASFDMSPEAIVDWGITDSKADQFWSSFGLKGEGIVVANIDTGVQYDHPALFANYKCGAGPHTDCWLDPDGTLSVPTDGNGHGTHTMGTMAAKDDPSLTYIAGMAPNAQWIACQGCDSTSCADTDLNACADWILAPGGSASNRPHVVNNSWGGGGGDPWYQAKVQAWQAAGIFPAFSAGNSTGCGSLGSPGDYQVSFGTTGHNSSRAHVYAQGPSATFGHDPYTKPNISAPASSICSSIPGSSWSCSYSGTSMASPHSAGAVALLWSCNPNLVGQMAGTFEALQNTADAPDPLNPTCGVPPDGQGTYEDGYGYLNVLTMGVQNCVADWGAIHGHATDALTSDPVEDVVVTAYRGGGGSWSDNTDVTGYYTVTVGAGTYTVEAVHPLYTTAIVNDLVVLTDTIVLQDFPLQPRGHLFGYVTDQDSGIPLAGTVSVSGGPSTPTDPATGYYEFYLDPGNYDVTASAPDYADETASVTLVVGEQEQQDFTLLAAIAVVPDPILITLEMGQTGNVASQMTNNMAVPYPFEFVEVEDAPGILDSGGPDPFGYTFIDSNEPGGALYQWIDATDGTPLDLADDGEANVTLPFAFDFYGTSSTAIRIGNNGGFFFNATTGDLSTANANLGTTTTNNLVVPFWDDIDADTGNVFYKTVGAEPHRTFVIEWSNRPHYSNVGSATFELLLYEGSNNIKYQYQDVNFGNASYDWGVSATVGIRQSGTNYLQYSYNQAVIQDGMAICFNYPGSAPCDGGDVPWFGTSITSGVVPAGNTLGWTNVFSATTATGISQPGVYNARLLITPSTIGLPSKQVSVAMTVLPSTAFGEIEGTVTSDRPGGPLLADIHIEATDGTTLTLITDPATGFYSYWLEAGSYEVTASATGYISQTTEVTITGLATTIQNFELVLLAPEIVVSPTSLAQTLVYGQSAQQTLTISNVGTTPLTFELRERPVNNFTQVNTILLMGDDLAAAEWDIYRTALSLAGFTWDEWDLLTLPFPTAIELSAYETLIWADENTIDPGDADCQVVADWLVSGNKSLLGIGRDFIWDLANGTPGAGEHNLYLLLNTTYLADYAGTGITTLDGVPGDPIGGDFAPPNGLTLAGTLDSDGDYASTASLATTGLIYGAGGAGSGNGGLTWQDTGTYKTVWLGVNFHNGLTNPDQRNLLMANMMSMLAGGDVPWLVEEPITGTVAAGSFVDITVTFDAGAVPEPGVYLADLRVMNNDPLNNPLDVPVTLNVEPTADLGKLEGTVTGLGYCNVESYPLEASLLIEAPDGSSWTVESGPNGYYYQWLYADTYTVTASAPEHLDVTAIAQVSGMLTTTLDLELPYIESCMNLSPTSFSVTLPENSQATELLTIDNSGAGELIWEVHETTRTVGLEAISIPRFTGTLPDDKTPVSVERDPNAPSASASTVLPFLNPGAPAYGIDLGTDTFNTWPDIGIPGTWTQVGSPAIGEAYAADFAGSDFSTLYVLDDATYNVYAVNTADGTKTLIGSSGLGAPQIMTGMAWDPTTNTMYASSTDGTTAYLYTLNLATGAATQVAVISGAPYNIAIAIDGAGQMYGHDIGNDFLITIDKTTGATQVIGSTGFTANYAQGMDYDLDNDILYLAAYNYNGVTGQGELRIADTTTGNTLLVGAFPGAAEVDSFAIVAAGTPPWNDVPWVTEVPTNGVVGPESSFDVEVTFDTTGLTPGECYTASLALVHDDPGWITPFYVPLELCVEEFVPVYGVDLEPEASAGSGLLGETITYTLRMTNTGDTADSYLLTTANVDPLWTVGVPVAPIPLAPGQGMDVLVTVAIPAGAADGEFDTFTLTATSTGDTAVKDDAEITTTAQTGLLRFMLPLVYNE